LQPHHRASGDRPLGKEGLEFAVDVAELGFVSGRHDPLDAREEVSDGWAASFEDSLAGRGAQRQEDRTCARPHSNIAVTDLGPKPLIEEFPREGPLDPILAACLEADRHRERVAGVEPQMCGNRDRVGIDNHETEFEVGDHIVGLHVYHRSSATR